MEITVPIWPIITGIIGAIFAVILILFGYILPKVSEISALKETVKARDKEIQRLTKENAELREQLEKSKAITEEHAIKKALLANKTFNPRYGIWKSNQSSQVYCPPCLDKGKESPLQVSESGWKCPVCNKFISNPDYERRFSDPEDDYDPLQRRK
jgi:regulator of replication initiation timing